MPCTALPRGGRVSLTLPASPPASFTPVSALAHVPPFNNITDNNPCGVKLVTSVNGVNVAAESLCLPHWAMLHGQRDLTGVIVTEP